MKFDNIILCAVAILSLLALSIAVHVIICQTNTFSPEVDSVTEERQQVIAEAMKDLSDLKIKVKNPSDSIVETIRCNQLLIIRQQENLVNDFRQEMNNNINKMNTWLAFAIGVMSIIGVFIPVALQFKLKHEGEAQIKAMKDGYDEDIKTIKEQLSEKVDGIQRSLSSEVEKYKQSLESKVEESQTSLKNAKAAYSEMSDEIGILQLWSKFHSFEQGYNDNILNEQADREVLLQQIGNKVFEQYEKISRHICEEDILEEDDRINLILTLIIISRVVTTMRDSKEHRRDYRELNSIIDSLRQLIVELTYCTHNKWAFNYAKGSLETLNEKIYNAGVFHRIKID